jgi:hypothetical protein
MKLSGIRCQIIPSVITNEATNRGPSCHSRVYRINLQILNLDTGAVKVLIATYDLGPRSPKGRMI